MAGGLDGGGKVGWRWIGWVRGGWPGRFDDEEKWSE